MARQDSGDPVAEFCIALRRVAQDCGLDRTMLARRLGYSRSQLYEILSGRIRRPPEWDRVVEPLIRACTNNDERAVRIWRRRHDVLVGVYSELQRQDHWQVGQLQSVRPAQMTPAQLPADIDVFTGRAAELAELDRLLSPIAETTAPIRPPNQNSTAVVISAVAGTAGVGKTALALRWAHRVRSAFPDGQLYVNLRGFDPDQPLSAADALAGFLRALGMANQDIPLEVEERAAAYRSLLDGRRMLILLDNASSVEQIRPLLPGTASCLVIVTSRDSLGGLVARHGARRLDLNLLPLPDAIALLAALIGKRVRTEPDAAAMLARQCARLPLALRVAAELAAARPTTSVTQLVRELADEQRRLELLDAGGDTRTAVRGVFSWSYQHLPLDAARAFRLIGLHPGPDFDPYAVAALVDISRDNADALLALLARAHLIQSTSIGRYGMHDLLRAYAIHLVTAEKFEEERRAGLTRLFDHYLATVITSTHILTPAEQHRRPRIALPPTRTLLVTEPAAARAWLDTERATLVAICAYTATCGWPRHTILLATILFSYLNTGGHYPDALTIYTHALRAARDTGDRAGEARLLTNLGHVYWQQGWHQQAADHFQQALTLACEISDRAGQAHALDGLSHVYWRQGPYHQAIAHLHQALALFRELGDQVGEARMLSDLGHVYWRQGHYQQAFDQLRQSLTLAREIGDRVGEARALDAFGHLYLQQGHYQQAADHHNQALTLFRALGDRPDEAHSLDGLGLVYRQQAHYQQSIHYHQQALALTRELGDRGELRSLNGLGEVLRANGQPHEACIQHTTALALAIRVGDRYEEARAHHGLAHIHQTTGDTDQAHHHWRQALAIYTDIGVPDVDEAHIDLTTITNETEPPATDPSHAGLRQ